MTESDQPRDAPTETERALRATSDALLASIEELATLEQEKRTVKAGDPRLVELSKSIERIAARVLGGTIEERVLTEDAAVEVAVEGPTAPGLPIEEVEPRSPHEILEEWRDAERHAAAVASGSPEAAELATRIERLRFEYRRAHERAEGRS
jgi:hypothetical protein